MDNEGKIVKKGLTLKQAKLLEAIPHCKTLKEAGIQAGYEENTRQIYRESTKRHIREAYSPEMIVNKFEELHGIALKRNDLSNANRSLEALSRINAMFKDKTELTTKTDEKPIFSKEDAKNRLKNIVVNEDEKVS